MRSNSNQNTTSVIVVLALLIGALIAALQHFDEIAGFLLKLGGG